MFRTPIQIAALLCALVLVTDCAIAQRGGGGGPRGGGGGFGGGGTRAGGGTFAGTGFGGGGFGGGQADRQGNGGMCSGRMRGGSSSTATQTALTGSGIVSTTAFGLGQTTQAASLQSQLMQAAAGEVAAVLRERPTTGQFVQAAMRFDSNRDLELSRSELTQVARAVISEIQTRQQGMQQPQLAGRRSTTRGASRRSILPEDASLREMTTAFVSKAMTFDRDDSGTLSSTETLAMAAALIRTMRS